MKTKTVLMKSLASLLLVIALSLFIFTDVGAEDPPRLSIEIFKYNGLEDDTREKKFKTFVEIIHDKISRLSEEIEYKYDGINQLNDLALNIVKDADSGEHAPFEGTGNDLYDHWNSSNALEVFIGRLRVQDSNYSVRSKVFLGDLKGALESKTVAIDLPISDEEFDTTRDSHSIITLYALAIDAKRRGQPDQEVLSLLSEAYSRLPESSQMSMLIDLETAIKETIENIKKQ
ncbi:hypothetical protein MNBD_DELTA01-217 [hydrothermal vent metagenome]|uniref:Uncharacterized protein n=1 Tax=hydrothermal vent metagenome TaxID=652676 RepID=A0A3B0QU17_9ZZZZ